MNKGLALLALLGLVLGLAYRLARPPKAEPMPAPLASAGATPDPRARPEEGEAATPRPSATGAAVDASMPQDECYRLLPTPFFAAAPLREARWTGLVVESEQRGRIPGARLELVATDGYGDQELATARSAPDGSFELRWRPRGYRELAGSLQARRQVMLERAKMERSDAKALAQVSGLDDEQLERLLGGLPARLELRVSCDGYMPATQALTVDLMRVGEHELGEIALATGNFCAGRVLGGLGVGLQEAEVSLIDPASLQPVAQASTDAFGIYVLHVREPGRYHIHARARDQGATVLKDVLLPLPEGKPLQEIVLRGGVRLAGRVRLPDGLPVEALVVRAVPAEHAANWGEGIPDDELVLAEMRGGLWTSTAVTDSSGRFEMLGMQEGTYGFDWGSPSPRQPPRLYETPCEEALLEFALPRLRVEIEDVSDLRFFPELSFRCSLIGGQEGGGGLTVRLGEAYIPPTGEAAYYTLLGFGLYEVSLLLEGEPVDSRQQRLAAGQYLVNLRLPLPAFRVELADLRLDTEAPAPAERRPERTRVLLTLHPPPGSAPDAEPPALEAEVARLVEGRAPELLPVAWTRLPPERTLGEPPACTYEAIVPGEGLYRLRVRAEGKIFLVEQQVSAVGGSLLYEASLPEQKVEGPSAR